MDLAGLDRRGRAISGVLFDLDNTLVDRDGAAERWLREALGLRGAELAAAIRADAHGHSDRDAFFAGLGDPALWPRFQRELPVFIRPVDGAHEVLSALRGQGVPMGLLSNGGAGLQRAKLNAAGLAGYFDVSRVLISGDLALRKPDPAAFRLACNRLGVARDAVLMVGDTPDADIVGAAAAGLATCWVANGRRWPGELGAPDFVVHTVAGLHRSL